MSSYIDGVRCCCCPFGVAHVCVCVQASPVRAFTSLLASSTLWERADAALALSWRASAAFSLGLWAVTSLACAGSLALLHTRVRHNGQQRVLELAARRGRWATTSS